MASELQPPQRARRLPGGITPGRARIISLLVWLIAVVVFMLMSGRAPMDALTRAALAVAVFLPAVVITMMLLIASATHMLREETRHLQGAIDALRRDLLQRETPAPPVLLPTVAAEEPNTPAPVFLSQRRQRETPALLAGEQPTLALDPDPGPDPQGLDPATLIRALHFPEDENDTEGFEALRRALAHPRPAALIRAAQDVLTRLAQEGIYMDDLRPDRARPEFWRAFAQGARGPMIAPLGGIRDRSCLAITTGRMRADPGFRAAVHLFLREFDHVLSQFEPEADDAQITALSETRSARAFMLLGRVSGVFSR
ncbi:MAG: hypothetical protein EA407_15440 [Rhodobacteraceae bacterium]|nr:MAG: hypothetical protein EA407_15440 [Paracoccaceae bacterium]